MYSDADLEAAIAAGVLTPGAAQALRDHVAQQRATPLVDEENFRLISGFNDIFVSIAAAMLLIAVGWLGVSVSPTLGGASVAAVSWGLAEYFTKKRRMALPSIILLIAFVYAVFSTGIALLFGPDNMRFDEDSGTVDAIKGAAAAALAAGAAWLHWRRFMVPITVAAGTGMAVLTIVALLVALIPPIRDHLVPLCFIAGLSVFGLAMWWDGSDRERLTRRSDVAFWLHLAAAPLLVHPIFYGLGLVAFDSPDTGGDIWRAGVAIAIYVLMALVALIIDRRALLVSSLVYVLTAMGILFSQLGGISSAFAVTALVLGSALLLMSALWQRMRAELVGALPSALQQRVPVIGGDAPLPHAV
jgi:MFS family permease